MTRKYRDLHPEREGDPLQLAVLFVGQSAPDIRMRLEGEGSWNLKGLLEMALEVYNNIENIKESRNRKRLAVLLSSKLRLQGELWNKRAPREGGSHSWPLNRNQCARWKQGGAGGGGWWLLKGRTLFVFPHSLGDIGRSNFIVCFMDCPADMKPDLDEKVQRLHPWRLCPELQRRKESVPQQPCS